MTSASPPSCNVSSFPRSQRPKLWCVLWSQLWADRKLPRVLGSDEPPYSCQPLAVSWDITEISSLHWLRVLTKPQQWFPGGLAAEFPSIPYHLGKKKTYDEFPLSQNLIHWKHCSFFKKLFYCYSSTVVCIFLKVLFLLYFPLPFNPLIPLYPLPPPPIPSPPPCNHHTVVHVHESFLFFARSLHPWLPLNKSCQLAFYESVSILLVNLFCSLDYTYEWNYMVFTFLWLVYFT